MESFHGLLMACHERIRRFTGGLLALCETPAEDERVVPTAQACLRYFEQALPLHAQDEEESLLPRLRALPQPPAAALEHMHQGHSAIEALRPEVCAELQRIAAGHALSRPELFTRFATLLREHIRDEEDQLFGRIDELPEAERSRMLAELRARRSL